jgi:hypothetical protein
MDLPRGRAVAWRAAMPNRRFRGGVHLLDLMVDLFGEPPEAVRRHSPGLDADTSPTPSIVRSSLPAGAWAS